MRFSLWSTPLLTAIFLAANTQNLVSEEQSPQPPRTDNSSNSNSGRISVDEVLEAVAKGRNNRLKRLRMSDKHNVACPHMATLIYSSGGGFGIIIPNFEMEGSALFPEEGKEPNAVGFIFSTLNCRFTIGTRKFALHDGVETEIALSPPYNGPATVQRQQARRPIENLAASTGLTMQGGKITLDVKRIDPDLVGTTELFRAFASPEPLLTFSGMVWFGPKNFSLYLGGVPKDLLVETRSNSINKTLEIDFVNATARMRVSVKKEVLVGDTWVTEFDE